jgi:putative flavoprotein involved in K+ transport
MRTDVTIIGGGQAGLAMSRCLTDRAIDHVVVERGRVANSWLTERWDSLRLLTPNWMTRLPGLAYDGAEPHGYMTAGEVAALITRYGRSFEAPVVEHTRVTSVIGGSGWFRVHTTRGAISTRAVVVATGANGSPTVPPVSAAVPERVVQLHSLQYRAADALSSGGVLVVGASASGVQIADEVMRSGREVTIAVGDHVRLPRGYRGRDIHWWMEAIGLFAERDTDVEDLERARRLPSAQLVGSVEGRSLGLRELQEAGVRLVGRLVGATEGDAQFAGSLANFLRSGDLKQARLLDRIDEFVSANDWDVERPKQIVRLRRPCLPPATRVPGVTSRRSSGPRATGWMCRGWTGRCWTGVGGSVTRAA